MNCHFNHGRISSHEKKQEQLLALSIFRLHQLWLTSLWVLRGQKCHFAPHLWTHCEHLTRKPYAETWGCRVSGGIRLNVNLWHPLAMNHICDSIRAGTLIIQHPWLSGWQQQYRAAVKHAERVRTIPLKNRFLHSSVLLNVFNISGPICFTVV